MKFFVRLCIIVCAFFMLPFSAFSQTEPPRETCSSMIWPHADYRMWVNREYVIPGSFIQVPMMFGLPPSDTVLVADASAVFNRWIMPQWGWWFNQWNFCPSSVSSQPDFKSDRFRVIVVGYPHIGAGEVEVGSFMAQVDRDAIPGDTIVIEHLFAINDREVERHKAELYVHPRVVYADLNGDSLVTGMDAALIYRFLVENGATITVKQLLTSDLDGNYKIGWYDLYLCLSYILGQRSGFPVEGYNTEGKGMVTEKVPLIMVPFGSATAISFGTNEITNGELEFRIPQGATLEPTSAFSGSLSDIAYGSNGVVKVRFAKGVSMTGALFTIRNASPEQIAVCGKVNRGNLIDPIIERATGVEGKTIIPHIFSLEQNYPNPFNPTTVIAFSVPYASRVTLKVYNLLGQEVATLMEGSEQSAGMHSVPFDASHLASGVYLYKMNAGEFVMTRRMVLQK
ncbi:MAG: T9SS type A sorting domain-containing protein [Candidatus Paceibacterota bacterium]